LGTSTQHHLLALEGLRQASCTTYYISRREILQNSFDFAILNTSTKACSWRSIFTAKLTAKLQIRFMDRKHAIYFEGLWKSTAYRVDSKKLSAANIKFKLSACFTAADSGAHWHYHRGSQMQR
jgi:hypothetical protein